MQGSRPLVRRVPKLLAVGGYRLIRPVVKLLGLETWFKERYELTYWRMRKLQEGVLSNSHYSNIFTTLLELEPTFYKEKRILDIGCGPRGSLEWADMAAERVGLDPLVEEYRHLGIGDHAMTYVDAPAEQIPYPDDYFDVVTSINSLDHVEDLDQTISEIIRVTAQNGHFLLVVEVNHAATIAEPHTLRWDIAEKFEPVMTVEYEKHFEQNPEMPGVGGIKVPFDHANPEPRSGILVTRLVKQLTREDAGLSNG